MTQDKINTENLIAYLMKLIEKRGGEAYLGEAITQYEHMVQTAACAEADGAGDEVIVAALLHDIGHFENDLPYRFAEGIDNRHEEAAATFLSPFYPAAVTEPIRLHVSAKRYLVAVDTEYFDHLSEASVETLRAQGGPMNQAEITEFESNPFYREAVKLRRYDDDGKVARLTINPVEHYRPLLESLLTS